MSDDAIVDRCTRQLLGEAGYGALMEAVQGDKSEFVARLFGLPKHSAEPQNADGEKPYTMNVVRFLLRELVLRR
jgi:hypothetical protein